MSIDLKESVQQRVRNLTQVVDNAVEGSATSELAAIDDVLARAVEAVESIRAQAASEAYEVVVPSAVMTQYFPVAAPLRRAVTGAQLREAGVRWDDAVARGRRFRDEARVQVGPLLTPCDVARRLGVSRPTLNNWRRERKLLALRFDNHQYLYPAFQFVDSPLLGEHGVLRHFGHVLALLGDASPWEQALFFLTPAPLLSGRSPLELLHARSVPHEDLDRLFRLAQHNGEMGS